MRAIATWWAGTPWAARWRALPTARRRQIWAVALLAVGLAFPFGPVNAGHVDAARDHLPGAPEETETYSQAASSFVQ